MSAALMIMVAKPCRRLRNATVNAARQFDDLTVKFAGRVSSRGKNTRKSSNLNLKC